jgi:membrane protease YdiL (CAAX protease family)
MIPDSDLRARPPLSLELVFVLALLAPLIHSLAVMVLLLIGFRGLIPVIGMGALLAYGGIFALCAARFTRPPMAQLALVRPPALAWAALLFLLPSIVLSSELDNWVKTLWPPPVLPDLGTPVETLPFLAPSLAIVYIAVLPIANELFFRGVMQPVAVARIGVIAGVLVPAILSGLARGVTGFGAPYEIAPACANALVFGILRQSSGSLWPSLVMHVVIGGAAFAAQYGVFGIPGFDDMSARHTPLSWVAPAVLSTLIGLAFCRAASRARALD